MHLLDAVFLMKHPSEKREKVKMKSKSFLRISKLLIKESDLLDLKTSKIKCKTNNMKEAYFWKDQRCPSLSTKYFIQQPRYIMDVPSLELQACYTTAYNNSLG